MLTSEASGQQNKHKKKLPSVKINLKEKKGLSGEGASVYQQGLARKIPAKRYGKTSLNRSPENA